jgi:hypothetical protein
MKGRKLLESAGLSPDLVAGLLERVAAERAAAKRPAGGAG